MAIRYQNPSGFGVSRGRLEVRTPTELCQVDEIIEVGDLVKRSEREPGFVITHVGLWMPEKSAMTAEKAKAALRMLHFWFGFLRGAWCGPVFPQGVQGNHVVWRYFAPWKLSEPRRVASWLPLEHSPQLSGTVSGVHREMAGPGMAKASDQRDFMVS